MISLKVKTSHSDPKITFFAKIKRKNAIENAYGAYDKHK